MLPVIQIGPLALRTPGLALLAGLWIGLEIASREGARRGLDGERIYSLGLYTLIAGVLSARLAFVLANLGLYTRITPWTRALGSAFALAPGTELPWVGALVALAAAAWFVRRWRLSPLLLADALAPGITVFVIGLGLSALLGGRIYGIPTGLPWGIELQGAARHPTQVYLMLAGGTALFVLLRLKRSQVGRPPGFVAQMAAVLLGLAVLLIEPLRADSPVFGPGIRTWSVAALLLLVGALAGFAARAPSSPQTSSETDRG